MAVEPVAGAPLIEARRLCKTFVKRRALRGRPQAVTALDEVTLTVRSGSLVGVVGESGSGKSTLARAITMVESPDSGEVWFGGNDLCRLSSRGLRQVRPQLQFLFQDSATAFNPGFTAFEAVEEPLLLQGGMNRDARRARVLELFRQVGIAEQSAQRGIHSFSGGQKQRLAIARALAVAPQLLVLDETFSGLDLSVRAQIVNLLLDLRPENPLTYVVISHDLAFVGQFCEEIVVMQAGRIVENGAAAQVLQSPQDEHTKMLLRSASTLAGWSRPAP